MNFIERSSEISTLKKEYNCGLTPLFFNDAHAEQSLDFENAVQ